MGVSSHALINSNIPYRHMVRWYIYDIRQLEHPNFTIKWSTNEPPRDPLYGPVKYPPISEYQIMVIFRVFTSSLFEFSI